MKILITGAGSVMGQSIYKALSKHCFDERVEIHFANSEILGAGRFFNCETAPVVAAPIFPIAKDPSYLPWLVRYVEENSIDIVFTGTQHELEKISAYRDETMRAATLPSRVTAICMDKIKTERTLRHHGIRVPGTQSLDEYMESPAIDGPVIVKPNFSSSSRSISRFENHDDVSGAFSAKSEWNGDFLVQERIAGDEYTCGCYLDRYSGTINQICFRRTLTLDGATFYGEIVCDPDISAYVEKIAKSLQQEGLDFGHFNVQLIIDEDGPCLFEINGRLSSTEASKAHFGFNSCAAFVYNIVKETEYTHWSIATSGKFLRYYDEVYFN